MSISSIHIEKSSASALIHNHRVFKIDYAIDDKNKNEYRSFYSINEMEKKARLDYQKFSYRNRALPKNTNLIKEAIVNLNENHTMEDLIKLKNALEKRFGFKIMDISIHNDEGHENIQKRYNHHAHIMLLNYNFETHKTMGLKRKDLVEMQNLVADTLEMERPKKRGKDKVKRLNTFEYKRMKEEQSVQIKQDAEIFKYNFREYQKRITALQNLSTEQKKELHRLNTQVRQKNAQIGDLEQKIQELEQKNTHLEQKAQVLKRVPAPYSKPRYTFDDELEEELRELKSEAYLQKQINIKLEAEIMKLKRVEITGSETPEEKLKKLENVRDDYFDRLNSLEAKKRNHRHIDLSDILEDIKSLDKKVDEISSEIEKVRDGKNVIDTVKEKVKEAERMTILKMRSPGNMSQNR